MNIFRLFFAQNLSSLDFSGLVYFALERNQIMLSRGKLYSKTGRYFPGC